MAEVVNKDQPAVDDLPEGMSMHNIARECWREYVYDDGTYQITQPVTLFLKQDEKGDSHRVLDARGVVHYVKRGWRAIRWKNLPGGRVVEF